MPTLPTPTTLIARSNSRNRSNNCASMLRRHDVVDSASSASTYPVLTPGACSAVGWKISGGASLILGAEPEMLDQFREEAFRPSSSGAPARLLLPYPRLVCSGRQNLENAVEIDTVITRHPSARIEAHNPPFVHGTEQTDSVAAFAPALSGRLI